jgi:hypothetical protein
VSEVRQPINPSGLARAIVIFVPSGVTSCETTSIEFVVWPPPCTRGNEAHDVEREIALGPFL